jgi:hypothetical protein
MVAFTLQSLKGLQGAPILRGRKGSQQAQADAVDRMAYATAAKAEVENVSAAESMLRDRTARDGSHVALEAFEEALASGDTVAAKAAQNVLMSQGSTGLRRLHDAISEAQANGTANEESVSAIRENAINNHMGTLKAKSNDLAEWAIHGNQIGDHTNNQRTWNNLSNTELAGQSADALQRAQQANAINPAQAAAILNDERIAPSLKQSQRAILEQVATQAQTNPVASPAQTPAQPGNQTTSTPPAQTQQPAPSTSNNPPGFTQASSGLYVPHGAQSPQTPSNPTPPSSSPTPPSQPSGSNYYIPHDDNTTHTGI